MKYGMMDIDWRYIGAQLAHVSDEEQASFLNSFATELRHACKTEYAAGFQATAISELLDENVKELLRMAVYSKESK